MEPGVTLSMTKAVSIDVAPRKRSLTLFEARDDAESKTLGVSKFLDWDASFVDLPRLRAASFSILTRPHFDSANHRRLMMGTLPLASRASAYKAFVSRRDAAYQWYRGRAAPYRRGVYEA